MGYLGERPPTRLSGAHLRGCPSPAREIVTAPSPRARGFGKHVGAQPHVHLYSPASSSEIAVSLCLRSLLSSWDSPSAPGFCADA